jgi:hypothetical protein
MKKFAQAVCVLILSLLAYSTPAGAATRVDLKDGSSIVGEVVSLMNGIYTIMTSRGAITIEQSKINAMQVVPQENTPSAPSKTDNPPQAREVPISNLGM